MLKCSSCRDDLPEESFYKAKTTRGYQYTCKECQKEAKRAPEKVRYARNLHLVRNHGITIEKYEQMLADQGGTCSICPATESVNTWSPLLHVDHDHKTGAIRGLLCHSCNVSLGHFRDDPALLRRAAEYLEG